MADPGPTLADLDLSQPGWYVGLSAPRSKKMGPPFTWIDPTRIYVFKEVRRRDLPTG